MRRGDICLIDLQPVRGTEASKKPTCHHREQRRHRHSPGEGVLTVVPVTSNVDRVYPFQVLLPAESTELSVDAKAQAEQVRSIDVARVQRRLGSVPGDLMRELDDALRLHLAL